MLNELIEKARQIELTTDANLSGAVIQVTKNLTLDEIEELFTEREVSKRLMKQIERVREDSKGLITIHHLRDSAYSIILNRAR